MLRAMTEFADIVLYNIDGTLRPLSAFAGRPTLIQTIRYFG